MAKENALISVIFRNWRYIGDQMTRYFAISLAVVLLKITIQDEVPLSNHQQQQKSVNDVNTFTTVNISECIELTNAYKQSKSPDRITSNLSDSQIPPLNRISVVCQDDLHQLCALFEFRGYFLIIHTNNEVNKSISSSIDDHYADNNNTNTNSNMNDGISKLKPGFIEPDNLRILTTSSVCCNTFVRCFTLPLDSDNNEDSLFKDWTIDFYWNRTPEMYEFGEDGWSSVGTPVGALSGVYDLVDVKLKYRLHEKFGFDFLNHEYVNREFVVHSLAEKRLQARVGDYYECLSETEIIFDTENTTLFEKNNGLSSSNYKQSDNDKLRIIMSLKSVKSQAFADVNVPEFTGASVVCAGDISHDMTLSIAIGLSLCALVVCVLFGLAINHLRQKDQGFKAVDTTGE
ncbi:unnamed protein product [Heterobilharzia americana]|nr:unnamed protein product [Heterobilharzia americana]